MTSPNLKLEARRLVLVIAASLAIGLAVDAVVPVALLFVVVYGIWHLVQLAKILDWLRDGANTEPPVTSGVWEELVGRVHRIQQRSRKRKKRLAKMLNRFQKSTKAMPDATVVLKTSGEIEWVNRAAERLLGLSRLDAGQHITNLFRDPELAEFLERGEYEDALEIPSPVHEDIILNLRIVRFAGKQLLLTARDVTRINRLESMRKDFVANVSHELRTPLTVLAGYLEALDDAAEDLPGELRDVVPPMLQQTRRMNNLVNDLLFLSRLEQGEFEQAEREHLPIDIPAMLRLLAENAAVLSGEQAHRIECRLDERLWLLGNPTELESAFGNMVSNAVRYTPAGGRITISLWQDKLGAYVSVSDTGIGIDEEHLPRLTERFYRVNRDRSRQTGGTGLGLAIVKHVLARHDARLTIESETGVGSEFLCEFPTSRIVTREHKSLIDRRKA